MDDALRHRLADTIQLWNGAERVVKHAELINRKLCEPSINELRYAGRWIILALDAHVRGVDRIDQFTTALDALAYANLCCMQAKHDAVDSIVLFLHNKIDQISERYGDRVIALYVHEYTEFLNEVDRISGIVTSSRGDRQRRIELYDGIIRDHLPLVQKFLQSIRGSEELMNQELLREKQLMEEEERRHQEIVGNLSQVIADQKTEIQRNRRRFQWSLWIGVFLGVICIALGILALYPDDVPVLHLIGHKPPSLSSSPTHSGASSK